MLGKLFTYYHTKDKDEILDVPRIMMKVSKEWFLFDHVQDIFGTQLVTYGANDITFESQ